MEVTLASSFGVQANTQTDPDNEYNQRTRTMFRRQRLPVLTGKPLLLHYLLHVVQDLIERILTTEKMALCK